MQLSNGHLQSTTPVSLEQINNARSIEELIRLYESQGYSFARESDLLDVLLPDWKEHQKNGFSKRNSPPPEKIPPLEVTVENTTYRIFGIVHSDGIIKPDEQYRELLRKSLADEELLFCEQNLPRDLNLTKEHIEILDHGVSPDLQWLKFIMSFKIGLFGPLILALTPVYLAKKKVFPFVSRKQQVKMALSAYIPQTYDPQMLALIGHNLPPAMEIELQERGEKIRYTPDKRRSAYQAEFVRHADVGNIRTIVVGAAHAWEIKYFLEDGVKNQKIIERAAAHAARLREDRERYQSLVRKTKVQDEAISVGGFMLGLTPYLYGWYNLLLTAF